MGSVLVVDDERSMREFLAIFLRRVGHEVRVAASGEEGLAQLADDPPDLLITDLKMPGRVGGLDLLAAVKARPIDTEVIVVTAYATAETALSAMKQGAYDYLTKPFKIDDIAAVIGRAMEKRALVQANAALREQVSGRYRLASLLGKSPAMQRLFDLIGKIHSTKTNVLITGESGTGKELVARALHSEGTRANAPFVAVNCAAIPDELMESELFGHVKGAFTGAVSDHRGLFVEADGGTLFLDEIGELSLGMQVKLLRALQERRVKPVGGAHERELDVRVIAATNRELEAEVARGAFRSDLYYRLNVIELRLPPLRQRREDIPLLIEHFLRRFATEQQKPKPQLSPAAMKLLQDYDYPGNVRELENIIERALTLSGDDHIDTDLLPALAAHSALGAQDAGGLAIPDEGIDLDRVLSDYERTIIERALDQTGGVRKRAANLLGISFRSLRYRLTKLGLDADAHQPDAPADPARASSDQNRSD
ncbi:sigma-54-dependent transcriptional regulator [Haliangium sp.]|uniref:sigma-54-dependent transcriptional regulator n=1 Tax=Haliangium sp. TaxID=2663208 RepID=UPI003D105C68